MAAPFVRQLLSGRDFATGDRVAAAMRNYIYVVGDADSRRALLVDPAYEPLELLAALRAEELTLDGVVLTHYHADHAGGTIGETAINGTAALLEVVDVPVHIQRAERPWVERGAGLGGESLVDHDSGDELAVGDVTFHLLHTPGHTPGSQCLLVGDDLVTGDTLFLRGCGRTDLPGGDPEALYESLLARLAPLGDETVVLCGHAYVDAPSATLGELRRSNPVLFPTEKERWLARFS
ncbi:MAG TPA: MBL fold metallo-hydrolase [Acidimicrobiales bacterium]|nr:MBL fold metallo-hydrolase [Acidimicrobiales bacterium]